MLPMLGSSLGSKATRTPSSTINQLSTELAGLRAEQDRLGGSAAGAARGFGLAGGKRSAHHAPDA